MSTDERRAAHLVKTLEDGCEGFTTAAEKLDSRPEVAAKLRELAGERNQMADELRAVAAAYGDDMPDDGSSAGALHRGWMALKDLVTGGSDEAVLGAAASGEDHAVEQYQEALNDDDVSAEFKATLSRQLASIESARSYVSSLS